MTIERWERASEITEWTSSSSARFFRSCRIRRYILNWGLGSELLVESRNIVLQNLTWFCFWASMKTSSLLILLKTLSQMILHREIWQKTLTWLTGRTRIWMKPKKSYQPCYPVYDFDVGRRSLEDLPVVILGRLTFELSSVFFLFSELKFSKSSTQPCMRRFICTLVNLLLHWISFSWARVNKTSFVLFLKSWHGICTNNRLRIIDKRFCI